MFGLLGLGAGRWLVGLLMRGGVGELRVRGVCWHWRSRYASSYSRCGNVHVLEAVGLGSSPAGARGHECCRRSISAALLDPVELLFRRRTQRTVNHPCDVHLEGSGSWFKGLVCGLKP
jgi:hypothetical protein